MLLYFYVDLYTNRTRFNVYNVFSQIENEYGHNGFDVCDKEYTLWLRDLVLNYVGNQAQLYTTDECNISYMECGHIPNVYSTVDFSPTVNSKFKFDHTVTNYRIL